MSDSKEKDYLETEGYKLDKAAVDTAISNVKNFGTNWEYAGLNKEILGEFLKRKEFSYDLNNDAFYQQMKDKFQKQGRLAMEDTMGQAAAMTGGYGNSYAQSAGQQAYYAQLDNLNDVAIQLRQMAYDMHNQKGTDMLNKLSALDADYTRGYKAEMDKLNIANSNLVNNANIWNASKVNEGVGDDDYIKGTPTKNALEYIEVLKDKDYYLSLDKEIQDQFGSFENYIDWHLEQWLFEGMLDEPEVAYIYSHYAKDFD